MAYDRNKIFEQAREVIINHKLFFIEDIVSFLPISKPTFYDYFPPNSDEINELKELLEQQRVEMKTSMRSKWFKSDNATLQVCLMKLICTDEERKKMAQTYVEQEDISKEPKKLVVNIKRSTDENTDSE